MHIAVLLLLLALLTPVLSPAPAGASEKRDRSEWRSSFNRDEDRSSGMFSIGLGRLSGSTLYHISYYDTPNSGIESELEFPLQTMLIGLEWNYVMKNAKNQDQFRMSFQWHTSIDDGGGKLKDSDWITSDIESQPYPFGVGAAHPGLDIYSESDIKSNVNIIDVRLSRSVWPSDAWAIGPLAGLIYQKLEFDASNVNQIGYGPYDQYYSGSYSGAVLTYEVTYTVPWLGLHTEGRMGRNVEVQLDVGYSPWARAKDEDDHILRQKLSTASTKGNATVGTLALLIGSGSDYLQLRGQYLKIRTKGTQIQVFYDGSGDSSPAIDDRIDSTQTSFFVLYSYRY